MCRRVLTQTGLPAAHRTARGALWSTSWELWESFWIHSGDHFRPEFIPIPFRSFSRRQFALALMLRLLFLARKRCSKQYRVDKYSSVCCAAFFLAYSVLCQFHIDLHMLAQRFVTRNDRRSANASANWLRENDLNGIGMNSGRK